VFLIDRVPPGMPGQSQGYALGASSTGDLLFAFLPSGGPMPYTEYWGSIFMDACIEPSAVGLALNVEYRVSCDDGPTRIDLDVLTASMIPADAGTTGVVLTLPAAGGRAYFDLFIDDSVPGIGDVTAYVSGLPAYPTVSPFAAQAAAAP
jgi:hypothetical protein